MLKQINDVTIKPLPMIGGGDTRPVKGSELFPELYANIFLCAKKNSGKSSVVSRIIDECSGRDTKILAFVSTIFKDNAWLQIAALCEKRKLYFEPHTSLKEEGVDLLEMFLKEQAVPPEPDRGKGVKPPKNILLVDPDSDEEDEPKRKKKEKYIAPEWIIVLDDLSTELKTKSVVSLLKKNRHLKAKVIVSSQYINDLAPESRKQIDTWLIFGSQNEEKLEVIYKDADIHVSYEEFHEMYKVATKEDYSFLYVDNRHNEFRRNFNYKFTISAKE